MRVARSSRPLWWSLSPLRRWLPTIGLSCTLKAFRVVPKPTDPSSYLVALILTLWVSSSGASLCPFFCNTRFHYYSSLRGSPSSWSSARVHCGSISLMCMSRQSAFTNVTRLRACRFLDIFSIFAICCPLRGERASFLFVRLLPPRWCTRIFGLVV